MRVLLFFGFVNPLRNVADGPRDDQEHSSDDQWKPEYDDHISHVLSPSFLKDLEMKLRRNVSSDKKVTAAHEAVASGS
jgi:hypothetical protein